MENKAKKYKNVFIRGSISRGEEVIKALSDLGGLNNYCFDGSGVDRIYFINHAGFIDYEEEYRELAKIIIDCYKEITRPEQWKDGDILIDKIIGEFSIFCHYAYNSKDRFLSYVSTTHQPSFELNKIATSCVYRKATEEEINKLHEVLRKCGRDWDEVNKTLVYWRWNPKDNDKYFFISPTGNIESCIYDKTDSIDENRYEFGNCFPTKEEAEAMVEKIKKLLGGEE